MRYIMSRTLLLLLFALVVTLCVAQTPTPDRPNWVAFTRTGPTTGIITWSAEPSAFVGYYYLGIFPTTAKYFPPAYCDPNWNGGSNWPWNLNPDPPLAPTKYSNGVVGLDPGLDYYAYVAAVNPAGGWPWSAYSSWETDEAGPLPVVLSSFTATLTASNFVTLSWTTQSVGWGYEKEVYGSCHGQRDHRHNPEL